MFCILHILHPVADPGDITTLQNAHTQHSNVHQMLKGVSPQADLLCLSILKNWIDLDGCSNILVQFNLILDFKVSELMLQTISNFP